MIARSGVSVAFAIVVAAASPVGAAAAETCASGYVALTFDDGPSPLTPDFLDVLASRDAVATFFVNGYRFAHDGAASARAYTDGHHVANHTWAHDDMTGMSDAEIADSIRRVADGLAALGVTETAVLRPPYGARNQRVDAVIASLGYTMVLWDVDPQDWRAVSAGYIADHVLSRLRPGANVLLHDGVGNSYATLDALPAILDGMAGAGYCTGVIDEHGVVVAPGPPPAPPMPPRDVTVIAGADRFRTSVEVSRRGWPHGAADAVVASGDDFPDALSAATLAVTLDAPLLLTPADRLDPAVAQELRDLGAERIVAVGDLGDDAISSLASLGPQLELIRGDDRYETSFAVARRAVELGADPSTVVVASGADYPDALGAGAFAALGRHPLVLVPRDSRTAEMGENVRSLGPTTTIVVGGAHAISDDILSVVPHPRRIAGTDRYATAAALADEVTRDASPVPVIVSGEGFADGLTAGVFAGARFGAPLLLTAHGQLTSVAAEWLRAHPGKSAIVVGGAVAVSPHVVCQLQSGDVAGTSCV